jgi:hypothetical protein
MKSTLITITLAVLVAIAPLVQGHAQASNDSRVNVPFGFNRGTDHIAAGTYKIGINGRILSLTDSNGHTSLALAQTVSDSGSSAKPGYVAFRKYRSAYFLAGYHVARGLTMTFGESKKERIAAREFASNPTDTGLVQLALLNDGGSGR